MKEDDPKTFPEGRENPRNGSRREDPNLDSAEILKKFGKDKRKRITRVEKAPGRLEGPSAPKNYPPNTERRSYNPNFTADNKLRGGYDNNRREGGYGNTQREDKPRRQYNRESGYGQPREERSHPQYNKEGGYRQDNRSASGYPAGNQNRSRDSYAKGGHTGRDGSRPPGGNRYQDNQRQAGPGTRNYGSSPKYSKGPGGPGKYNNRRNDPNNYPKYPRERQQEEMRLNRFLSMSGICSRREADELIAGGLVTINGAVVTEMGSKVQPDDVVRYNGAVIRGDNKVYIVMNKPKGYVTSLDDPHAEKTVMDILGKAVKERVYPVGRLDKNSMGLLLITNDGDMTKKLTHPSYEKKKIYQVTLDKALDPADKDGIAAGIELDDGFIRADAIDYVNDDPREIGIEIHSGRNRIVRRIFEHFGYQVLKLDRVYFAGLTKKNLKRGAWRFLNPREVAALHSGQYE